MIVGRPAIDSKKLIEEQLVLAQSELKVCDELYRVAVEAKDKVAYLKSQEQLVNKQYTLQLESLEDSRLKVRILEFQNLYKSARAKKFLYKRKKGFLTDKILNLSPNAFVSEVEKRIDLKPGRVVDTAWKDSLKSAEYKKQDEIYNKQFQVLESKKHEDLKPINDSYQKAITESKYVDSYKADLLGAQKKVSELSAQLEKEQTREVVAEIEAKTAEPLLEKKPSLEMQVTKSTAPAQEEKKIITQTVLNSSLAESFKKIYLALREGQSGFTCKTNFLAGKESLNPDELIKAIESQTQNSKDGRTAKTWELAQKHHGKMGINNVELFTDVYRRSHLKSGYCFFIKRSRFTDIINDSNKKFSEKQIIDAGKEIDTRASKIFRSLYN